MMADFRDTRDVRRPAVTSPDDTTSTTVPTPASPPASARPSAPSEPRSPERSSFLHVDLSPDRPARLELSIALVLGLVLIAIPLYLWRRPRTESIATTAASGTSTTTLESTSGLQVVGAEDAPRVVVGPARTLLCQDSGSKKTAAEDCDHLVEVETALAKAITESSSCMSKEAGGGTVTYVAEVSFKRKAIGLSTPKDGRTYKSSKLVAACQTAVKAKMHAVKLDAVPHVHQRYKVAIAATYPPIVR